MTIYKGDFQSLYISSSSLCYSGDLSDLYDLMDLGIDQVDQVDQLVLASFHKVVPYHFFPSFNRSAIYR